MEDSERLTYFYHSFPRRFRKDTGEELENGLKILKSIHDIGFILTPEITEWQEPLDDGTLSKPWKVIQKRCCFTELSPNELEKHTKSFGCFSLEFNARTIRQLGGIPVFYLPKPTDEDVGLESLASALIARTGEIQKVLNRLSELSEHIGKNPDKSQLLGVGKDGNKAFFRTSLGGTEDVLSLITRDTQPINILRNALRVITGFFYPAEDFRYTGILAYYQQREWRFVANMSKEGMEINRDPTESEKDQLLKIDSDFFGKELEFFTGTYKRVDQCRIFSELNGKSIYRYANRIIVPDAVIDAVREIFNKAEDPPVISVNEL
jgi:hypothetical protein